jgi:hypothetical protein
VSLSDDLLSPLDFVIDNLPYLAEELAYNFNEKLQLRLALNWDIYAISNDMSSVHDKILIQL